MKKNKNTKVGIVVAVLLLAVGFAAVSTTLYINGTAIIKPDTENFVKNVVFMDGEDQPTITSTVKGENNTTGSVTLDGDKRVITFVTPAFTNIGDNSVVEFDVENKSQYNAVLADSNAISCSQIELNEDGTLKLDSETKLGNKIATDEHISIVASTNYDGQTIVKDGNTKSLGRGSVTVSMIKSYVGGVETTDTEKKLGIQCTIGATAAEATTTTTVAGE